MKKNEISSYIGNKTTNNNNVNKLYNVEIGNLIVIVLFTFQKKLNASPTQSSRTIKEIKFSSLRDSLIKSSFFKKEINSKRNESSSYFVEDGDTYGPCLTDRGVITDNSIRKDNREIIEMNIKILNYNKLKNNQDSNKTDFTIENEMLNFFKNQNKFEGFLTNEDFLQNIFNLISVNLFRIPKYKSKEIIYHQFWIVILRQ